MKTQYDMFNEDRMFARLRHVIDIAIKSVGFIPMTYVQFKNIPEITEIILSGTEENDMAYQLCFAIYNFEMYGKKIYEVAPNLARRFSATNIKSVPTDLFKMPFKSILLEVPSGFIQMRSQVREGMVSVKSIYVSEVSEVEGDTGNEQNRFIKIFVFAEDKTHSHFFIKLWLPEVHACVDAATKYIKEYQHPELYGDAFDNDNEKMMRNVFEFVMKSILYIVGLNSDIVYYNGSQELISSLKRATSPGRKKEIERKLQTIGSARYKIGSKIVLSRNETYMYNGLKQGLWKLSYRFIVQGHYRNQACGPMLQERKLIFIDPFWKGPDYSEMVTKPHLVT